MVAIKPGVWCDPCIADLIGALNLYGIETVASCCGHGNNEGRISLKDGRDLTLTKREGVHGPLSHTGGDVR
jgi:hypothetical protein